MKRLLWPSVVAALLLVGCRDSPENREEDQAVDPEDSTEEVEDVDAAEESSNANDEDSSDNTDTFIGALTDEELIPIEDYDSEKWESIDLSSIDHRMESQAFKEENGLYIGTQNNSLMHLDADYNVVWEDENPYGYQADIAIDEDFVYNPALGSERTTGDAVKALDKNSGEIVYQIDISDYAEVSEITTDDEAIYLTLGAMSDPEEDIYADTFSLHKFDKTNGEEIWSVDFEGTKLGGNRPHYYQIKQTDDLLYLVEEENQKLVARSKEDGSEVWSETFGEGFDAIRFSLVNLSNDSVYVTDRHYNFHVFDSKTGEKQAEYAYNGEVPGGNVPLPVFYGDLVFWQHVDEEKHQLKAVNPKAEEELWTLDLDDHFLVDYEMVGETLYAFFGSIDYDAEENTLMARIEPETGEILDLVDMGKSISEKYNNYYRFMGLTEHEGNLAYFHENDLFIFNE